MLSALGLVLSIEASARDDRVWERQLEVLCHSRVCDVVRLVVALWIVGHFLFSHTHTHTHTSPSSFPTISPSRNVLDAFGVWFCISLCVSGINI